MKECYKYFLYDNDKKVFKYYYSDLKVATEEAIKKGFVIIPVHNKQAYIMKKMLEGTI